MSRQVVAKVTIYDTWIDENIDEGDATDEELIRLAKEFMYDTLRGDNGPLTEWAEDIEVEIIND